MLLRIPAGPPCPSVVADWDFRMGRGVIGVGITGPSPDSSCVSEVSERLFAKLTKISSGLKLCLSGLLLLVLPASMSLPSRKLCQLRTFFKPWSHASFHEKGGKGSIPPNNELREKLHMCTDGQRLQWYNVIVSILFALLEPVVHIGIE